MRAVLHRMVPTAARELLLAERLLLDGRGGFQRAAPYLILFVNLFADGYLHTLLREDPSGLPLALFFFLKSSVTGALFLVHYLTVSEMILRRIDHLPVGPTARFSLVLLGGLRTPGISGLLLTDLLFLAVVFGDRPLAAAVAVIGLMLLALGTIGFISGASLALRRTTYPVTALAALSALGFVALGAALVVFRTSGLLPLVPLVWITQRAVAAALQEATPLALVALGGLAAVSGTILYLGRRVA